MMPSHIATAGIAIVGLLVAAVFAGPRSGIVIAMIFSLEVALPSCVAGYYARSIGQYFGYAAASIIVSVLAVLILRNSLDWPLHVIAASILVTSIVTVIAHFFRAKDSTE